MIKYLQFGFWMAALSACSTTLNVPPEFIMHDVKTDDFQIRTYQKITSDAEPIHVYIEGDGNAFNKYGQPTNNPTPHAITMRQIAMSDESPNVVYVARPCQFIMSETCEQSDWTDGRFSEKIIENMYQVIKSIAKKQPVMLIGYSGGAMISGLIIEKYPNLDVQKWITIAGVLNHSQWTHFFGDMPLQKSLDMKQLPQIPQIHYVAEYDSVVPMELSVKWVQQQPLITIPNATHNKIHNLKINF